MPSATKSPVHVVFAANAKFNMPLCVTLTSLVCNFDPERLLRLYVLSRDSGPEEQAKIRDSVAMNRTRNVEIHWPAMDPAWFANLPSNERFSTDCFSRLFAAQLMPPDCAKFLYLDCDMVVLHDVGELLDAATGPTVLHAVHDIWSPWAHTSGGVFNYEELGIPAKSKIFNSGLLVIDVQQWREKNVTARVVEYAVRHQETSYFDQMALNATLYNDWTELDPRWNQCLDIMYDWMWVKAGYTRADWLRSRNDPYIIHYTGALKPWHCKPWKPRFAQFFKYLDRTVYKGTLPSQWFRIESLFGIRAYAELWGLSRAVLLKVQTLRGIPPAAQPS